MSELTKHTVTLAPEDAGYVEDLVSSGAFASANEVVGAALHALQDRDIERWLKEEVAPVCDAMDADPSRALGLAEVFADLRARHSRRLAGRD